MTLTEWRRKLHVLSRAERIARARVGPWLTPFDRDAVYAAARAAEDALAAHYKDRPK